MIGSHDTFTYLEPSCKFHNLTKRWWRTQCKNIIEQYNFGVRFFDIRVCLTKNRWTLCHGIVNFKYSEKTLYNYCLFMKSYCPEAIYRIVLEKGDFVDRVIFIKEASDLCNKFDNLWRIDIKSYKIWNGYICNNDPKLFDRGYKFTLVNTWEKPAYELHGYLTANNFYKINLKKEAQKINNNLEFFKDSNKLQAMIDSKDELYFLDYCTNEY